MKLSVAGLALIAALWVTSGIWFGPDRAPAPGRESTLWLAVESSALDGDLVDRGDRSRYRTRFGREPEAIFARADERGGESFDAPWLWSRLAGAARAGLGPHGPFALQAALAALAAWLAWATLASRLGAASAAVLVAVVFGGSALVLLPFRLEPRAIEMAAMAVAAAAVWHRRQGAATAPETIYRGGLDRQPSLMRWALSGLSFGLVAAGSPAYLPLAMPLVLSAPAERRGRAGLLFVLLAGASFGLLTVAGGAPWEPIEWLVDLPLWLWSALGLLVGRDVGLLPSFLPVVLLIAGAAASAGKRSAVLAAALALVAQVVLAPFDFADGALSPGNAWFVPVYLLLLCACEQSESRGWTLAPLLVAAPFLASSWVGPVGTNDLARKLDSWSEPVRALLPVATTLRTMPGAVDLVRPELLVRGLPPAFTAGGDGRLRVVGARASFIVASNRPLSSVRIELGGEAPNEIAVSGGSLGNTTFRPNGEVAFDVALREPSRRHAVWWNREGVSLYVLELRLPESPAQPLPFDLPLARGKVPVARREAGRQAPQGSTPP